MKSRYLILVPIILLALLLIPVILLRNEVVKKNTPIHTAPTLPADLTTQVIPPDLAPRNNDLPAQPENITPPEYTQITPSPDGIGKVFMGREISHPAEMLQSLHTALKPGGKIYLLEYRGEDPRVPIKPLHKMTAAQAIKEFEALSFRFTQNKRYLPWQHLLVFTK